MDGFVNYDALAGSIDMKDITSDERNADILRRIRDNDPRLSTVYLCNENELSNDEDIFVTSAHEAGWLGYFVGRSTCVKTLGGAGPLANYDETAEPFFRGVGQNKSIESIELSRFDVGVFRLLGPLFKKIPKLRCIVLHNFELGADGCRVLSLALAGCMNKLLTDVSLNYCQIQDDHLADIAIALSMHPNMESLALEGNNIGRKGCMALATLLNWSATKLRRLDLESNGIDDDGMEALVLGSKNLESLNLSRNPTISARGWRALSTALEHPGCSLETLNIQENNTGDEETVVLASELKRNKTLRALYIDSDAITATGWAAMSKMLGDTSNVNATFMSNHTLHFINRHSALLRDVEICLRFNRNSEHPATSKILLFHKDIDMQPFFEWDFKVLPLVIDWFAKASSSQLAIEARIQPRKLSAIYKFIRGMPLLYIESRVRGELAAIESVKSEMEKEQLKLQQERLRLDMRQQELEQRKRAVEERKRTALARLRA